MTLTPLQQQGQMENNQADAETGTPFTTGEEASISGLLSSFWDYMFTAEKKEDKETRLISAYSPSPQQVVVSLKDLSPDSVFHKVQQYINSGLFPPSTIPYNIILRVTAQVEGPRKVEQIVDWFMDNHKDNHNLKPDSVSVMEVLQAWRSAGNPYQCEEALRRYVATSTEENMKPAKSFVIEQNHFNVAISAWSESKHPRAVEQATRLFEFMQGHGYYPNIFCYTSLIMAWARSNTKEGAENIERLFGEVKTRWQEGDMSMRPNGVICTSVLWGLSRSSDPAALEKTTFYYNEMKEMVGMKPIAGIWNSMMAAYARNGQLERVEHLFQELKTAYEQNGLAEAKPDLVAYTVRLHAWSKAGQPEKTAEILAEMIELREQGEWDEKITTRLFNAVLNAWLQSKRADAAEKAEKGLNEMLRFANKKHFDCQPDEFSFCTAISAHVERLRSDGTDSHHTMTRILSLFEQMKDCGIDPTNVIYNSVMTAG